MKTTRTENQNNNQVQFDTQAHKEQYHLDNNGNLIHNEQRAAYFRLSEEKVANLLGSKTLTEKDRHILKVTAENSKLLEEIEVMRNKAFIEQCQKRKAEKTVKKLMAFFGLTSLKSILDN